MRRVVAAALLLVAAAAPAATQSLQPFIPVGVVVSGPDNKHLAALARRRFNVVGQRDRATGELRLSRFSMWFAAAQDPKRAVVPADGVISIPASVGARELRLRAWLAIANGARGIVFEPLAPLMEDEYALDAASEFADNVTRNAALFAPLRPREVTNDVRIDPASSTVETHFLESTVALVLIVANQTTDTHRVTLKFSTDIPEAIWQNMETGAAINFVASPGGPTYTRTFTPFDVIVLMIRKQYK